MALIKCKECGKEISDTVSTCIHCGCQVEKTITCKECKNEYNQDEECCPNCGYKNKPVKQESSNSSQTFCLVGMIVAIISCLIDFYGLVSATGLTFSIVGLCQTKSKKHKKYAILGIVCGGIELVLKAVQLLSMYYQVISY